MDRLQRIIDISGTRLVFRGTSPFTEVPGFELGHGSPPIDVAVVVAPADQPGKEVGDGTIHGGRSVILSIGTNPTLIHNEKENLR